MFTIDTSSNYLTLSRGLCGEPPSNIKSPNLYRINSHGSLLSTLYDTCVTPVIFILEFFIFCRVTFIDSTRHLVTFHFASTTYVFRLCQQHPSIPFASFLLQLSPTRPLAVSRRKSRAFHFQLSPPHRFDTFAVTSRSDSCCRFVPSSLRRFDIFAVTSRSDGFFRFSLSSLTPS
jgi:hypothetical protein